MLALRAGRAKPPRAIEKGYDMFSFGRQNGMRAILALVLALVPLVGVLMLFPQLGDQVPMKVGSAGEVLRWGSKWELVLIPAFGFLLSGATISMGLKNAKSYRDDANLAVITFQRATRNAVVQGIVFIVATGVILYGVYSGGGIGL